MRFFYSILLYFISPYLLFRLWWKGRRLPAYRERIKERFSFGPLPEQSFDVWIHAVSLGEVIAAAPLIENLLGLQRQILVTTMTPTGAQRAQSLFGNKIQHRYLPYELPYAMRRFFKAFKPRIGIIFETELWPNMIHYASQANIPLYLFNARLSEKSCRGYQKIRGLIKPLLNQFSGIYAQSQDDAHRFKQLGADSDRLSIAGNIKFDLETASLNNNCFDAIKERWGKDRVVVILASTHGNEEALILQQLKKLQQAIPGVLLIIAPRHPERFQDVFQLSRHLGFHTGLRSLPETIDGSIAVLIIDSLGELLLAYQQSDYAFVGGSLVPTGGHNVLEPIAMAVPVFSGKHVHNFKTIISELEKAKAIRLVDDAAGLIEAIIALHQDELLRKQQIAQAERILQANKGSIARYVEVVEGALK